MEIDIIKILEKAKLKKTHQRVEVLKNLSQRHDHPSVDEIYQSIKDKVYGLSKATLYNMLETFSEKGILEKMMCTDGKLRYDFVQIPHHHIHTIEEGTIVDYQDDELNRIVWNYLKNKNLGNYEIKDIKIEINVNTKK